MSENAVGTVIVGGGIGGCALAYYLANLGETGILVVEANELASGCTGGSSGGVRQQFSTPHEVELALRGRRFWQAFEEAFERPCAYHQDGYLIVTGIEETYERLADAAEVQRGCGAPDVHLLSDQELDTIVPWMSPEGLVGGCWTPQDGRANPTDGVYGLVAAGRALGVRFQERTRVEVIERGSAGWILRGPETITAQRVVVASGLGSPALIRPFGLELPIRPMLVHVGFTTAVLPGQRLPMTIDLDTGFCVSREQDGAVVTMLDSSPAPDYGVEDMLLEFASVAAMRAPAFMEVGMRATMSAAADATGGDGHPFIGEVEPGLWTMTGFDAHGTMMGPPIAEFTANLILGIPDPVLDPATFDPHRPATEGGEWLRAARARR